MKKQLLFTALFISAIFTSGSAGAEYKVENIVIKDKAVYDKKACIEATGREECGCEIDAEFPVISTSKSSLPNINKAIGGDRETCGKEADVRERTGSYKIFEPAVKNGIIGITSEDYYYSGGAHGMGGTTSIIADTSNDKVFTNKDVLGKNFNAAVKYIYDELQKNGDTYYASEETRHNGPKQYELLKANERNLNLSEEGIKVIFSPYSVGPYSSGTIEVKIPNRFIEAEKIKKVIVEIK